jgi:phosphotransferase system HPr (HPr) family protein
MAKVVKKMEIKNKLGVHARAAALLVQTVNRFSAQVTLSKDGQSADGRSIMGVLMLAATQGSTRSGSGWSRRRTSGQSDREASRQKVQRERVRLNPPLLLAI